MEDMISRKALCEYALNQKDKSITPNDIMRFPSAQPEERTENTQKTHACDCISRKAAIDVCNYAIDLWHGQLGEGIVIAVKKKIEELPSAQPEPCVDTIDALDESIKHFDDMAEECRRNANIEQNDYMDMRDDAAEYRQLSIWLNELKWLRERFQSQPDLSEYSDKLWKAAYERGKAEAQQKWIPCSERLPKKNGFYLCTTKDCITILEFIEGNPHYHEEPSFVSDVLGKCNSYVVAWMPLPEPYREEGEE